MKALLTNPIVIRAILAVLAAIVYVATQGKVDISDMLAGLTIGIVASDSPIRKKAASASAATMMALVVLFSGCTPQKRVDWPRVLECGSDIAEIVATVTRILMADGVRGLSAGNTEELKRLALAHGTDAVACTIKRLVDDWTAPGATQATETIAAAERGMTFLHQMGVEHVSLP